MECSLNFLKIDLIYCGRPAVIKCTVVTQFQIQMTEKKYLIKLEHLSTTKISITFFYILFVERVTIRA